MPDFRPRQTSIDPQAFANVLQRKAAIEQEQANLDRQRKDDRFKRITDAVVAGQTIADNMLTISAKRQEMLKKKTEAEGRQQLGAILTEPDVPNDMGEPTLDAKTNAAMLELKKADRNKRFLEAAVKSGLPAEKLLELKNGKDKNYAPQQVTYEDTKTHQPKIGILKDGKVYYPNTEKEVPPEEFGAKGYKGNVTTDAAGNLVTVSGSTGQTVGVTSTAAPGTKEPKNEAKNIFVLPAPRRAEFVKTIENTKNDPSYRGEINKVLSASTFERSLAAENQILDSGAALQFRKVFGDAGNISVVEQKASEGDKQAFYKAQQMVSNLGTGKLSEHNRQIMRDGLKVLRESAQKNLLLQTELQAKSMKEQYPELSEKLISENILGKGVYSNLKKKYPNVSDEFTQSANSDVDTQVNQFFQSLLGKK